MSQASQVEKRTGRSIVAGEWAQAGAEPFQAVDPARGVPTGRLYYPATDDDLNAACWAAWDASYAGADADARADMLLDAAERISALGDDLISLASSETGLGPVRLIAERERTIGQLRTFSSLIRNGDWVDASIDTAEPARRPVPKPDVRSMLRPIGPVCVFPPSNFPLAYSVAGGDVASALAAGCPVIIKAHPSHPGTSELVGRAMAEAVQQADLHPGFFSMLQTGGERAIELGQKLVAHACVRAVGFTGSLEAGQALAETAGKRADPIPVFAEMGSTNPVFVLEAAIEAHADSIAKRLAESACNANGQMCTSPGLIFALRGVPCESLAKVLATQLNLAQPETMLSAGVRDQYINRTNHVARTERVDIRGGSPMSGHRETESGVTGEPIKASPVLFQTDFDTFRSQPHLREEIFGPAMILVACDDTEAMVSAAALIRGSLTGTIWASGNDANLAQRIGRVLEQRVGRLIFNGVPTGVEVCTSMVHSGPFPATNADHVTAVGPRSIRRWVRPVCYQNTPEAFLPPELRDANPLGIRRMVNGELTEAPV